MNLRPTDETQAQDDKKTRRSSRGSMVSLIDFQMTVANLSVAEHALREEPYERLPYLAGSLQVALSQMESLRQEAIELRGVAERVVEVFRPMQDKGQNVHTFELLLERAERAIRNP